MMKHDAWLWDAAREKVDSAKHVEHGAAGCPSRVVIEKTIAALSAALFLLKLGPSFVRAHNEAAFVAETLQTAWGVIRRRRRNPS